MVNMTMMIMTMINMIIDYVSDKYEDDYMTCNSLKTKS